MRSKQHPWGLPKLRSPGDQLRLEVGNWLLRLSLAIVSGLGYTAGTSSLEHPRDRGVDPYPSIWVLPEVEEAERAVHPALKWKFHRRNPDLCMYGMLVQKKSTLSLNCKDTESLEKQCNHPPGYHKAATEAAGWPSRGPERTKLMRLYPKRFCTQLARVHVRTMLLDEQLRDESYKHLPTTSKNTHKKEQT